MATRIQLRRDTAANWTTANSILAEGEIGYETNTGKYKIGTGAATWSSLSYFTSGAASGTVTSVALSTPTGLTTTGSPVTTSGTLAVAFTAGYSIPTTSSQTNWDSAYTNRITSLTTTGSSGAATLSSNVLNIPNYAAATFLPVYTRTLTTVSVSLSHGSLPVLNRGGNTINVAVS